MPILIGLLRDNPLLLLAVIAGLGYLLGQVKIAGVQLGAAAVLFTGLAIGSLDPDLKLPEVLYQLGLILFVYMVGLNSGPGFFASLQRKGLRDNLLILGVLALATALTILAYAILHLRPALAVGMFAGSLTNTPALASILDYLRGTVPPGALDGMLDAPVVGYSVTYPIGVLGMILAVYVLQHLWRINYADEARQVRELNATGVHLTNRTLRVTNPEAGTRTLQEWMAAQKWDVVFGRLQRAQALSLARADTRFQPGDLVSIIGTAEELDRVMAYLGQESAQRLELDRTEYDHRRIFVSNPKIAGHRLQDLNLPQQFGAVVTRVRRGDVELLPHEDTTLELGDRVRVVTRADNMAAVSDFFGDSYRSLSEIDVLSFSLGLALGLAAGLLPIPLPGGITIRLGLAGGPLVVALVLGQLRRSGPLLWNLPYSANLTLRQVGLVLFLAGIGSRAGYAFLSTLADGSGLTILIAGAIITTVTALVTLWLGYKVLKIPMGVLTGILAGLQTQPALLGFALQQAEDESPNLGYATVYPMATIAKVVLAQLLIVVLK